MIETKGVSGQRAKDQIDILYKISQAILHQQNVSTLLEDVLAILDTEMGMSRGILTLRKPETDILIIEASKGLTEKERKRGQYVFGEGIIGRVAQTQKPEFIQDISTDSDFLNKTRARGDAEPIAFLCVPVIHLREVIGTISIDRETSDTKTLENDLNFLKLVLIFLPVRLQISGNRLRSMRACWLKTSCCVSSLVRCISRAILWVSAGLCSRSIC